MRAHVCAPENHIPSGNTHTTLCVAAPQGPREERNGPQETALAPSSRVCPICYRTHVFSAFMHCALTVTRISFYFRSALVDSGLIQVDRAI